MSTILDLQVDAAEDADRKNTLEVPPPILSRAFQAGLQPTPHKTPSLSAMNGDPAFGDPLEAEPGLRRRRPRHLYMHTHIPEGVADHWAFQACELPCYPKHQLRSRQDLLFYGLWEWRPQRAGCVNSMTSFWRYFLDVEGYDGLLGLSCTSFNSDWG